MRKNRPCFPTCIALYPLLDFVDEVPHTDDDVGEHANAHHRQEHPVHLGLVRPVAAGDNSGAGVKLGRVVAGQDGKDDVGEQADAGRK